MNITQRQKAIVNERLRIINGKPVDLKEDEILREAFAVYMWILESIVDGRAIVSADKNLTSLHQLQTPNIPSNPPTI